MNPIQDILTNLERSERRRRINMTPRQKFWQDVADFFSIIFAILLTLSITLIPWAIGIWTIVSYITG